jgi:hypothetical protein
MIHSNMCTLLHIGAKYASHVLNVTTATTVRSMSEVLYRFMFLSAHLKVAPFSLELELKLLRQVTISTSIWPKESLIVSFWLIGKY